MPKRARGLFLVAQALAFFVAGVYAQQQPAFAGTLADAFKTLRVLTGAYALEPELALPAEPGGASDADDARACGGWGGADRGALRAEMFHLWCRTALPRAQVAAARFEFPDGGALDNPVLVQGGRHHFRELCPDRGCLAVVYADTGAVRHAYPWRPEALEAARVGVHYPYERQPGQSFADSVFPFGLDVYPNGDLLVVLHRRIAFPGGVGIARIAPDGQPRWFRQDLSHHWPSIGADGIAVVPGRRLGRTAPVRYSVGLHDVHGNHEMGCPPDKLSEDYVSFIDGQGRLLQAISVLDALAASPYNGALHLVADSCDPMHLNFAHRLGPDAGDAPGLQPGDIVVSLRQMHAFAVLDRDDYRVKRFVRGSFLAQHSVRHLTRAQFLLFDNGGTDGRNGPSRLLRVDLATGEETTLFPTDATPAALRPAWTPAWGHIDVSPDRRRALFTDLSNTRGLEIRLADGRVLAIFHNLHDVAQLPAFPPSSADTAWRFRDLWTLAYAPANGP